MKEKGFWEGAQAAMPTALGYVSIGLACGIIGLLYFLSKTLRQGTMVLAVA